MIDLTTTTIINGAGDARQVAEALLALGQTYCDARTIAHYRIRGARCWGWDEERVLQAIRTEMQRAMRDRALSMFD